ncbi:T9SS type A sorting domain-containing protein [Lewinella sp. LCG006]|uniref:T9SS type A sorting domain-containing protein n=1 Tax=Lewinella sp. LCG006 TaxID=3231911 RepID=UPI0034610D27
MTVKQTEEGSISLYPNPVSVGKYLTLEGVDNRGDSIKSARLISANGQQWPINHTGSHQLLLPTQLAPGLYYLQLVTNSSSQNLPVQIIR